MGRTPQCKRFQGRVIEQRDAIAVIAVRTEQCSPGEKLSILEILLGTDTQQLRGMGANVRKPGSCRDSFCTQCADEHIFCHSASLLGDTLARNCFLRSLPASYIPIAMIARKKL